MEFQLNAVGIGRLCVVDATDRFVTGSVADDYVIRADNSGSSLWLANSGTPLAQFNTVQAAFYYPIIYYNTTPTTITATTTVTVADLLAGLVQLGGVTASQTLNWDTATNIVGALKNPVANMSIRVLLVNQSTQTWTLGSGTGITTQYTSTSFPSQTQRTLVFQITSVASPAVTVWG